MEKLRRIIGALAVAAVLLAGALPAGAAGEGDIIRQLISHYSHHREEARLDIELLLGELASLDGPKAAAWEQIMSYWAWVNEELDVHQKTLDTDLPEDDSLCIVVMGYQLKKDGGIRPELEGRLKTALAAAEQYPNAYIACTGGPTAANNSRVSEASQMAAWLVRKGVSRDRIIIEDESRSTLTNAKYTCGILYEDYPAVRQLAVITSDYHLRRSSVYFNTQAQLAALELGVKPLTVTGNAACRTVKNVPEDMDLQTEGVASLAGVSMPGKSAPKQSRMSHILVSGEQTWPLGTEPSLEVRAVYTTGRSRDVTYRSVFSGFDLGKAGAQQITVTYAESGKTYTALFDVEIVGPAETVPETVMATAVSPTEPEATEPAEMPREPREEDLRLGWLFLIPAALLLPAFKRRKG